MRRATGYDTRGANDFRPSRKDYKETHGTCHTAAAICEPGKLYCEIADLSDTLETVETHLIPRKSLTNQLHLTMFPQSIETVPMDAVRRDPKTGHIVSLLRKNRQVWKSDRSLLTQGKPESSPILKRETSRSHRRIVLRDDPAVIEIPVRSTDLPPIE